MAMVSCATCFVTVRRCLLLNFSNSEATCEQHCTVRRGPYVGVGFKMSQQLREKGVATVQELRCLSEDTLAPTFGASSARMLAQLSLCATSLYLLPTY